MLSPSLTLLCNSWLSAPLYHNIAFYVHKTGISPGMQFQRKAKRIEVDIPVTVTTVIDSLDATIVDLTEYGAQVTGCGVPAHTRFQIDYMGQTVFAICRWSEIDRMGVKFIVPVTEGPLYERLQVARAEQREPGDDIAQPMQPHFAAQSRPAVFGQRSFGRAAPQGFGRKTM
jgi:hypothetical protein